MEPVSPLALCLTEERLHSGRLSHPAASLRSSLVVPRRVWLLLRSVSLLGILMEFPRLDSSLDERSLESSRRKVTEL